MNTIDLKEKAQQDSGLLSILTGMNASAGESAAIKARRSVRNKLTTKIEQRSARKHNRALTLAIVIGVLLAVAPIISNVIDDFLGDEHFGDMSSQMTLLAVILVPAALAALFAGWKNNRHLPTGRRN
jgi:di/tricarboxylate transporter